MGSNKDYYGFRVSALGIRVRRCDYLKGMSLYSLYISVLQRLEARLDQGISGFRGRRLGSTVDGQNPALPIIRNIP